MNRSYKNDTVYEYCRLSDTSRIRGKTEYVRAGKVEGDQAHVAEFVRFRQFVAVIRYCGVTVIRDNPEFFC